MMWSKTKRCIMLLLLPVCCLYVLSAGSCSEAAEAAEETIVVSKKDWNALKLNNEMQRKALSELWAELLEARTARDESSQALTEAKALLESLSMTTTERQEKLMQLLEESRLQKEEIAKLKNDLTIAKTESLSSYESIQRANQFLADTRAEIEAQKAEWRKRENQLERQRLLWQIVSALCAYGGYQLAK